MNISVPGSVATYLAAEAAKDTERLGECFHEDAVVRDEGREHRGIAAIKAWHREVNEQFRYVVEPIEASGSGPAVVVRARVSGDFPGSPIERRFHFTVSEGKVASLEVTA
jgi:ketosteroid isomerase-like protein